MKRRVLTTAMLGCLLGLVPLVAVADSTPQLSISIDDGRVDTTPGSSLTYEITVTNLGSEKVQDLRITHAVSPQAKPGKSHPEGKLHGTDVRWTLDLSPGKAVSLRSDVTLVDNTPDHLLRFATTACAYPNGAKQPTVCAADSDQLPAGAAAAARETRAAVPSHDSLSRPVLLGGSAALAVVGLALLAARRYRRRRGAPMESVSSDPEL